MIAIALNVPNRPTVAFVSRACNELVVKCYPGDNNGGSEIFSYTVSYYLNSKPTDIKKVSLSNTQINQNGFGPNAFVNR